MLIHSAQVSTALIFEIVPHTEKRFNLNRRICGLQKLLLLRSNYPKNNGKHSLVSGTFFFDAFYVFIYGRLK